MNKVFLSGEVKSIPGLRSTKSGQQLLELPVTVAREWNGQRTEETINVTFWADKAEKLITDLIIGDTVVVEGRISSRVWKNQQGEDRLIVSVNGSTVDIVRGKGQVPQIAQPAPPPQFGAQKQHTEMSAQEFLSTYDTSPGEVPF